MVLWLIWPGSAVALSFAGFLLQYLSLGTPLLTGASMKSSYDNLLTRHSAAPSLRKKMNSRK